MSRISKKSKSAEAKANIAVCIDNDIYLKKTQKKRYIIPNTSSWSALKRKALALKVLLWGHDLSKLVPSWYRTIVNHKSISHNSDCFD